MYTDGDNVYESSYRYRDGRNGMNRVSTLQQFLSSKSVDAKDKQRILKKLESASPDIVLEM
jgi:23S rRNA maturation mini-RNase III